MGLLHVACCKIDFEKSLQEGEMYNYKSYIYYIYYNIYNIYKIICNYFFEWKHENATCNMQQDTVDLKYINNSEPLLYRKKQLKLKLDFSITKRQV